MSQDFGTTATYQFYRTGRWLDRVRTTCSSDYIPGSKSDNESDNALDYVLAFFLNCYHVKDWLKKGPGWRDDVEPTVKRKAIEQFINESDALSICADLCNGSKHFNLDEEPRSGRTPEVLGEHHRVDLTQSPPIKTIRYTVRTGYGDFEARALAERCFEQWKNFIDQSTPQSLEALAKRNVTKKRYRKVKCPA